jgi:D-alanine-D-alanine ligase
MKKPKIAFVTGGYSGEAEISYQSAKTIEKNIDPEKFDHYKIDITTKGWFYQLPGGEKVEVDKNDFSLLINNEKINFDAVLIGIHGTPGEDGKLQGYFDMLQIPYTSCDCAISALTFNKRYTVAVAAFSGINVANSVLLFKNNYTSPDEKIKNLRFPVFVKPNNGGSSIGMSKVNSPSEELGAAIEKAFKEDDQVLVEEFIKGREFTIGVFRSKGKIIALPVMKLRLQRLKTALRCK